MRRLIETARRLSLPRRSRDENGVVAVVVAIITCFTLIPLAAFAVDIGVQRVARRDAQSVADVVALDLARQLNGRTYAQLMAASPSLLTLAQRSADRNKSGGDFAVTVDLGTLNEGNYDPASPDAYFVKTTTASVVPTAIRVNATAQVGFTFISGSGGVSRSAVSTSFSRACFKVGSFALGLATNKSALNGLLGNALGLSALGYDGLANANVSLLGLATQLGAATPNELVSMPNLTLGQLVSASGHVLANTTPHDSADVTLLQTIKAGLDSGGRSGTVIDLGKLLDVGTGSGSALDASLNVFDLLTGSAFLANGDAAIAVPNLGLTLPGVGAISTSLKVIEPPRMACGKGATARTGQVRFTLDGSLSAGVPLVLTVNGPIHVDLGLAVATGTLRDVTCVGSTPKSITIDVTEQQAASTSLLLGNPTSTPQQWLEVRALSILLGGLRVPLANVGVSTVQTSTTGTYTLDPWDAYLTTPFHTPQTPTSLPSFTGNAGLLGLPLGGLLNPLVNSVLNPLVTALNGLITGVLAPALGLQVAGVDLFSANPPPNCVAPNLTG